MEKCWKRMQVPKGFTILMMMMLALFALIGVIVGIVLIARGGTWIIAGVPLLMIGLTFFALFIVWIIFIEHHIYAPIGSKKNYGERKPINTKYHTYTYSTWLWVFAMTLYPLPGVILAIASLVLFIFGITNDDVFAIIGFVALLFGGGLLGLWSWFLVYQIRPMYKNKKWSPGRRQNHKHNHK